jgi:hypothetical protein
MPISDKEKSRQDKLIADKRKKRAQKTIDERKAAAAKSKEQERTNKLMQDEIKLLERKEKFNKENVRIYGINFEQYERILDADEAITAEQKKHVDLGNQLGKIVKGSNRLAAELIGLNSTSLALREQENNQILEMLNNTSAVAEMSDEELASYTEKLAANNALSEIQKQVLNEAQSGMATQISEQDILNQLEEKGVDITKLTAAQMKEIKDQVEGISKGAATLADDEMAGLLEVAGQTDATLEKWKGRAEMFGAALKNPALAITAMKATAITMAMSFAKDLFDGALKFKQELGLSAGEAAKLSLNVTAASKYTKMMGGDASLITASASEMVKQFGDTSVFTAGVAKDMANMAISTGFGGANAAKLLKTMEGINGASIETNINTLEAWGNLAKAEGVSSKIVLDDIANSTEEFAKFAKGGGDNIIKAATAAAKLGLEMSDVAKITTSLLSIEDSLRDEMEAEMLIGKQLNLDKARELALAGDLEGVMNEVKNIGVSQAEWSEMNVIQRQALAKAVGVEVGDMGKLIAGEKTSAQVAAEKAEKEEEKLLTQERMMKGMMVMQGISAGMLAIDQARAGFAALQAAKSGTEVASKGVIFGLSLGTAVATLAASVIGIGAIAGVLALAYGAVSKGKTAGAEEGGEITKTGTIMAHKGEVYSGTKNEMGFGVDMTETNKLLKRSLGESKQLREQNQLLMNKLIRTTGDLQLANA